jgi:hypothetical protein
MFSSCSPTGAFEAGVKIGCASFCACESPAGSLIPQIAPVS